MSCIEEIAVGRNKLGEIEDPFISLFVSRILNPGIYHAHLQEHEKAFEIAVANQQQLDLGHFYHKLYLSDRSQSHYIADALRAYEACSSILSYTREELLPIWRIMIELCDETLSATQHVKQNLQDAALSTNDALVEFEAVHQYIAQIERLLFDTLLRIGDNRTDYEVSRFKMLGAKFLGNNYELAANLLVADNVDFTMKLMHAHHEQREQLKLKEAEIKRLTKLVEKLSVQNSLAVMSNQNFSVVCKPVVPMSQDDHDEQHPTLAKPELQAADTETTFYFPVSPSQR